MPDLRLVPVSGSPIDVVKDEVAVGRDPSCEIVVTDGSVSRRHAKIERRAGVWWVVDQGSANGTYVNSLKVAEQALKSGQELRFGALAFRVEITEDSEATVATPILADEAATVLSQPPAAPVAPPPIPRPAPAAPRSAAPPPPVPPSAAAARDRFRSAAASSSPVPQMPAGPAPAKKGRSPLVWVGVGCCGCLLLVGLLIAVIGGGAMMATKPAADAAHAWIGEVRQSRLDEAQAGLSSEYRGRLTQDEMQTLATAMQRSKDETFWQRSVDNDKAVLTGVLTGADTQHAITVRLVKEGGAWKVDDVRLGGE